MEEIGNGNKNPPSIPANYVSILQLQKRWTEEQERKQKETVKSKEPRLNLRSPSPLEDDQVRLRNVPERKRREDKEEGGVGTRKFEDKHVVRRNRTDLRWMPRKSEPESSGKMEECVCVAIDGCEEETKDEGPPELKGKKKKKHWKGKKANQTRQEKGVVVDDTHASLTDIIRPNTEVRGNSISKTEGKVENSGSAAADPAVEVERKLAGVSIYRRKEYRISTSKTMPNRDYGRQNLVKSKDETRKPRNAGMVWVRKDEATESSSTAS